MHSHTNSTASEYIYSTSSNTTPTTSYEEHADGNATVHLPMNQPALTRDFHLDMHYNPIWTSGPHVFMFAEDGRIVQSQMHPPEHYPRHHVDHTRSIEPVKASHSQGFVRKDPKPWKNVAITEQDNAEFEALLQNMKLRTGWEPARQGPKPTLRAPSEKP